MVGGRLRALGPLQHLKTRFGGGFTLDVRIEAPAAESVAATEAALARALGSGQSSREGAGLTRDDLTSVCAAMGKRARDDEISEAGTGWSIAAALAKAPTQGASAASTVGGGRGLSTPRIPLTDVAVWWTEEDWADALVAFVRSSFAGGGGELIERHGGAMRFRLPAHSSEPLSALFRGLEAARAARHIQSYSLGQTTLEQVGATGE
jgi:ATP-binding cassette, subfamily A (ABC1), member 3